MKLKHSAVMAETTVNALTESNFGVRGKADGNPSIVVDGVFVDGTFGRGGHSRLLLDRLSSSARLLVFDKDPQAIEVANEMSRSDPRIIVVHDGFGTLPQQLYNLGIKEINGIMLDLGVSSPQIDDAKRGFSFMRDGPLDMRMNTSRGYTAAEWLAQASINEIREVIARYGEERFAFQIAKAIVSRRESRPLCTTLDLAELVASVVRTREKGQHPATRTFQAIRIHINQELQELALALTAILRSLATGGRMAVISFHSLEDRMVKQCMAAAARPGASMARLPVMEKDMPKPVLKLLGRYKAKEQEIKENPRARSAVLRVAERTEFALPADQGASFVKAMGLVDPGVMFSDGGMAYGAL